MAREAYRSLYGDLTKLKDTSLLDDPAGGAGSDDELFQLLLAVSVAVDDYCNRRFYPLTTTRTFDGPADVLLPVRARSTGAGSATLSATRSARTIYGINP